MNAATPRLRKEVTGQRGRVAMEEFKEQLSLTFLREERIMQMLRSVMFVIRRAMSVLASEDAVSKRSILPVAWVAAAMMAAAVVLNMPDKAQASTYCWASWGPNTSPAINCNSACLSSSCATAWGTCLYYGSSRFKRCRCHDGS